MMTCKYYVEGYADYSMEDYLYLFKNINRRGPHFCFNEVKIPDINYHSEDKYRIYFTTKYDICSYKIESFQKFEGSIQLWKHINYFEIIRTEKLENV